MYIEAIADDEDQAELSKLQEALPYTKSKVIETLEDYEGVYWSSEHDSIKPTELKGFKQILSETMLETPIEERYSLTEEGRELYESFTLQYKSKALGEILEESMKE